MAVRGRQYRYVGPGRELFLPGDPNAYYPPERASFTLAFEEPSHFWDTPFWSYADKPFVINFDQYGGSLSNLLASPWGPDAFNSQISLRWTFDTLTGEFKLIASAFAAQFMTGVPFPIPWLFEGTIALAPHSWYLADFVGNATYSQSGIAVAAGVFHASIFAVAYS